MSNLEKQYPDTNRDSSPPKRRTFAAMSTGAPPRWSNGKPVSPKPRVPDDQPPKRGPGRPRKQKRVNRKPKMSQSSASKSDSPARSKDSMENGECTVARPEHSDVPSMVEQFSKILPKYADNEMFNRMKEEINKLNQSGQLKTISSDAPTLTCMLRELFELGNHGLQ
ncbi:unnamed protein product [Orchesella dallaii]|uniref:Uncharacterized protein n=1 Tax=Orchesella dallaii TaxID=48710 RepID=A0ABP1PTJ3_9HEXA